MSNYDLVDDLLNVTPGSRLDRIRRHRTVARDNTQRAYDALFEPIDASQLSVLERAAVASFVAALHAQDSLAPHYANLLGAIEGGPAIAGAVEAEIARGETTGPYGDYPPGPLSAENLAGLHYQVSEAGRLALGPRLTAAFEHAHLLVFRPRDAGPQAIAALAAAGISTTGIVTLSQLVSYIAFQVRLVEGLTALAASAADTDTPAKTPTARPAIAAVV